MQTWTLIIELALLFGPGCPDGCPVLIGAETPPPGVYQARAMSYRGFGFLEDGARMFAVHPTWTANRERLLQTPAWMRRRITDGCVNMRPSDFNKLPTRGFTLEIKHDR